MDPRSDSSKRTTAKQAETYRTEAYVSRGRCGVCVGRCLSTSGELSAE